MNHRTRTAKKDYYRFFLYIPVENARDSAFPFATDELVRVRIDKVKKPLVIGKDEV